MTLSPAVRSLVTSSLCLSVVFVAGCASTREKDASSAAPSTMPSTRPATASSRGQSAEHVRTPIHLPQERRLKNLQMLTDGGENAEAYWSFDSSRLIFQARRGEEGCDRILSMTADGRDEKRLATKGAHTCAFYLKGDDRVVYASTMTGGEGCPPPPDHSKGYVWAIHADYEIYSAKADGSDVQRLTESPGYDAEATVGPDGTIVFTSVRTGDLEIFTMSPDGSNVVQLTTDLGYDGGPFFSPDGSKIIYRRSTPMDEEAAADYRALIAQNLVRPSRMEIWVMDADGGNKKQLTDLGRAAFAPNFTPDGQSVVFASNHLDPSHRNFDLFLIGLDGGEPERVTYNETFDSFPMFSPDGRKLAFCSNRGNAKPGETNIFVADWVAQP